MTTKTSKLTFLMQMVSVVHKNEDGDPTVILHSPPSNMVVRHPISLVVNIDARILECSTSHEVYTWLNQLYKGKTLSADHKHLYQIADDLNEAIDNEYPGLHVTIQVMSGHHGITTEYDNRATATIHAIG